MHLNSLPGSVREVADVIGRKKALHLVGSLPRYVRRNNDSGGKRSDIVVYVPTQKRMKPDHQLVTILGYPDAQKMARHFGGALLRLESCRTIYTRYRNSMILKFHQDGMSVQQVADTMAVTDRTVRTVLAELTRIEPDDECRDNPSANASGKPATGSAHVEQGIGSKAGAKPATGSRARQGRKG